MTQLTIEESIHPGYFLLKWMEGSETNQLIDEVKRRAKFVNISIIHLRSDLHSLSNRVPDYLDIDFHYDYWLSMVTEDILNILHGIKDWIQ